MSAEESERRAVRIAAVFREAYAAQIALTCDLLFDDREALSSWTGRKLLQHVTTPKESGVWCGANAIVLAKMLREEVGLPALTYNFGCSSMGMTHVVVVAPSADGDWVLDPYAGTYLASPAGERKETEQGEPTPYGDFGALVRDTMQASSPLAMWTAWPGLSPKQLIAGRLTETHLPTYRIWRGSQPFPAQSAPSCLRMESRTTAESMSAAFDDHALEITATASPAHAMVALLRYPIGVSDTTTHWEPGMAGVYSAEVQAFLARCGIRVDLIGSASALAYA